MAGHFRNLFYKFNSTGAGMLLSYDIKMTFEIAFLA